MANVLLQFINKTVTKYQYIFSVNNVIDILTHLSRIGSREVSPRGMFEFLGECDRTEVVFRDSSPSTGQFDGKHRILLAFAKKKGEPRTEDVPSLLGKVSVFGSREKEVSIQEQALQPGCARD